MNGRDPGSRPGPLPRGLLGALALMVAAECFAARHENDLFLTLDVWSWARIGQLAERPARGPRIVCLGDSLVQVGVASRVIEKQTGIRTDNFAISGGQAASSYFLLRRALEAGGRPEAILVDFFALFLSKSPVADVDRWPAFARLGECLDLAWSARDPDFLARVVLAKVLPTARARNAIRGSLLAALRGEDRADRQHVPPYLRRNLVLNRGGLLCPSRPGHADDLDSWARSHFPADWSCDPVNEAYVRRILALATSRRIPVYWLLPPFRPALQERCERSGFDARYEAFVRRFQAEYPIVSVADGRRSGYDDRVFFDPHHLGRDGACVYSAEIAAILGRPAPARWVGLPPYRARPADGTLEDVDQSRLAVRQNRARVVK